MGFGWDDLANIPTFGQYGAVKGAMGGYGSAGGGSPSPDPSLNGFPEMDQASWNLFSQYGGGPWEKNKSKVRQGIDVFKTTYRNATGSDPSNADVNKYLQNVIFPSPWGQPEAMSYNDHTSMASNFIENNYDLAKLQRERGAAEAPNQYGAVDKAFQSNVGRVATQEEKDHFGKLLANGELDPYTMGQWLQQLPESVKKQDAEFRQSLTSELQGQDQRYFSEQVMPTIQSSFAQQGRSVQSSGFANALAQQAGAQNRDREGFLSNLTASQYGGNKANAYESYLNSRGRYEGTQDYGRMRSDALSDQSTNRLYDIQNYQQQKMAYDNYLRNYGKRSSSGVGSLAGGVLGGVAGAYFGGPAGAGAGYQAGSALGGAAENYWS